MRLSCLVVLLLPCASAAGAQAAPNGYPVKPVPLADSVEIALAVSAAPPELSNQATVYAVRDGQVLTLRRGSNGSACVVARDLHGGSLYPICYNAEGARTVLARELLEVRLRSLGASEDSVERAVAAGYASGQLETPKSLAMAYMMSPRRRATRIAMRASTSAASSRSAKRGRRRLRRTTRRWCATTTRRMSSRRRSSRCVRAGEGARRSG